MAEPEISDDRERMTRAVALFSVLMHARDVGELQEAAAAQRELDELGVIVRLRRKRRQRRGGGHV
jgi:hypothetical protein